MAKILGVEDRVCPFCGYEYERKLYQDSLNRGSICPKCRKRSDRSHHTIGKWHASKLKECANPECNNMFYSNGVQKYCSIECYKEVDMPRARERIRRWREKQKKL